MNTPIRIIKVTFLESEQSNGCIYFIIFYFAYYVLCMNYK